MKFPFGEFSHFTDPFCSFEKVGRFFIEKAILLYDFIISTQILSNTVPFGALVLFNMSSHLFGLQTLCVCIRM